MQQQINHSENKEVLKVSLITADVVSIGKPNEVEVSITNVSPSPVLVNKRLSVGYQASQARELFFKITERASKKNVGKQTVLYERDFSIPSDYIWLKPNEHIDTRLDLFKWYQIPAKGSYEITVCYQADEGLAHKPEQLITGTFCSEPKLIEVEE
jgi:hypothetical protein